MGSVGVGTNTDGKRMPERKVPAAPDGSAAWPPNMVRSAMRASSSSVVTSTCARTSRGVQFSTTAFVAQALESLRTVTRTLPSGCSSTVTPVGPDVGLGRIDHTVANVERGTLDRWVQFYEDVFGFRRLQHFEADQIATEFSALRSTVVWDGDSVVFPINEPADGRKKSQIEEYLDYYGCPGVQHVAMTTPDKAAAEILAAVKRNQRRALIGPDANVIDFLSRLPFSAFHRGASIVAILANRRSRGGRR